MDGTNICAVTFHLSGSTKIQGPNGSLNRRVGEILARMSDPPNPFQFKMEAQRQGLTVVREAPAHRGAATACR
jgi:hypothetical protein